MSYKALAFMFFGLAMAWPTLGVWSFAQGERWSWPLLIVCALNGALFLGRGVTCWAKGVR